MTKELWICIIIVILVFGGNMITQKYTKTSISEANEGLSELREELMKENVDKESAKKKMNKVYEKWNKRHPILSYYIEHDEIEKVETDLAAVNGDIEIEEYKEAVVELDRTVYVLEHIKNKTAFNLENIF